MKILDKYTKNFQADIKHRLPKDADYRPGPMEVLGLPLLTHLAVRLMVRWPTPDLQSVVENPTTLYRLLTDMTCEKGGRYGRDVHEPTTPGSDLRQLLHETAVAMTTFGRDSIPYDELDFRLSQLNEDLVETVKQATEGHPITSLMISFFFKGGRRELGAEFLHKSFREFLFAEAVVETLKNYGRTVRKELPERDPEQYWKDFEPTDPRYDFSRRLGKLLAAQWLSKEVASYIEDLIAWELSRVHGQASEPGIGASTASLDLDGWERIRAGMADLWDWWGEGVHLRPQPQLRGKKLIGWEPAFVQELIIWAMSQEDIKGQIPAPPRSTAMDAHLGEALCRLAVLTHHYLAVAPDDSSEWEDFDERENSGNPPHHTPPVRRYQSLDLRNNEIKVRFRPSGQNQNYFFNYIGRINAGGWYPELIFPTGISLQSVDFRDSFLVLTGFARCNLQGATLSRANLFAAFLQRSDLTSANFSNCRSPYARFDHCITYRTRFDRMLADHASFTGVDLSSALDVDSIKGLEFDGQTHKKSPKK